MLAYEASCHLGYTLSSIAYLFDILNMIALGVLFYEMIGEKSGAVAALKSIDSKNESIQNSLGYNLLGE